MSDKNFCFSFVGLEFLASIERKNEKKELDEKRAVAQAEKKGEIFSMKIQKKIRMVNEHATT